MSYYVIILLYYNQSSTSKYLFCSIIYERNIAIYSAYIADLTRIAQKKLGHSWTSLIKVEGLFVSYIVTHFDIVNSESLVQRYIQLFLHWTK